MLIVAMMSIASGAGAQNLHNGHAYIDLGLSVKWATYNVGADSPDEYGDYYAWGETATKSSYYAKNCITWEQEVGDISGTLQYDAATAKWGGSWRMPSLEEFNELQNNCTWEWTTLGGANGYKVIKYAIVGAEHSHRVKQLVLESGVISSSVGIAQATLSADLQAYINALLA